MKIAGLAYVAVTVAWLAFPAFAEELRPVDHPEDVGFASDRLQRVTEAFQGYVDAGRLHFTCDYREAVEGAQFAFIAVGTPSGASGEADMRYCEAAARSIAQAATGPITIVNKSTMPIGAGNSITNIARQEVTVVTSAAGYPLDKTYYQTVKGMVATLDILEAGANLIVASECSEGMGSPEYVGAQRRLIALGPDGFLREIEKKRFADIDEWQTQMQLKPMRIGRIHLYCGGPVDPMLTGVSSIDSVERAVQDSAREMRDPHVAVIPEGPYVIPYFQPVN